MGSKHACFPQPSSVFPAPLCREGAAVPSTAPRFPWGSLGRGEPLFPSTAPSLLGARETEVCNKRLRFWGLTLAVQHAGSVSGVQAAGGSRGAREGGSRPAWDGPASTACKPDPPLRAGTGNGPSQPCPPPGPLPCSSRGPGGALRLHCLPAAAPPWSADPIARGGPRGRLTAHKGKQPRAAAASQSPAAA